MTYGEFFIFYMALPWLIAAIMLIAAMLLFVLGGSELRTIISGKLNPRAQFVLGWSDGGRTELKVYTGFEPNLMMRGNYKEFLTYSTPLGSTSYQHISLEEARRQRPGVDEDKLGAEVEAFNLAVDEKNAEMITLNRAASTKTSFCGKPLWLGHLSRGAALQPELLKQLEKTKGAKKLDKATMRILEAVNPDTINDFMVGNFNSGILYSILRRGEDFGKYGKPKQPFPMMILVVALLAIGLLVLGFLIISGKLDVSGFVQGLGLGV